MQQTPAVTRPAWLLALSGSERRSPVEIVASAATYLTRSPGADLSGLRTGRFGQWADGVTAMRGDCALFASHWQAHNARVAGGDGPLWVALGDSTAQGLGAASPDGGYVGQVLAELRLRTGAPWRVLNLSVSGALTRDVLARQLPQLPAAPALVTCGIGANDVLYTAPSRLFADLRALIAALPAGAVVLDLPLPAGCWGMLGRVSMPYVARINRVIRESAAARSLPVAPVSGYFIPPWNGKVACDRFHPSQAGYRDWARALLAALPAAAASPGRADFTGRAPGEPAEAPRHPGAAGTATLRWLRVMSARGGGGNALAALAGRLRCHHRAGRRGGAPGAVRPAATGAGSGAASHVPRPARRPADHLQLRRADAARQPQEPDQGGQGGRGDLLL